MKLTHQQKQIQLLSECDESRLFWFDTFPRDADVNPFGLDFIGGYSNMPSHFSGVE